MAGVYERGEKEEDCLSDEHMLPLSHHLCLFWNAYNIVYLGLIDNSVHGKRLMQQTAETVRNEID